MDSEYKKVIEEYETYAKENGLEVNSNQDLLEGLAKRLLENEKRYGNRYCPCRVFKNDPKIDDPNICPCTSSKKELEEQGHCLCWLFLKK